MRRPVTSFRLRPCGLAGFRGYGSSRGRDSPGGDILSYIHAYLYDILAYNRDMTPKRKKTTIHALAFMLAEEVNEQGIVMQTFTFSAPVLGLPEGDSIVITVERRKQPVRMGRVFSQWEGAAIMTIPAGVEVGKMTDKYDCTNDINEHRRKVKYWLSDFANLLLLKADTHDKSKLEEPEKEMFDEYTPKLKEMKFGSQEYKAALAGMGEGLKHH